VGPNEDENRYPPHLNPLPPGERKEKIKDEILTPLKTEGERARGGEGEKKIKN